MMLAPQFSLRRLLFWVSISALLCLVVAAAARGQLWAVASMIALFGLCVVLALHGLTYGMLKFIGAARDRRQRARQETAPP
jgi:hypothetical protein